MHVRLKRRIAFYAIWTLASVVMLLGIVGYVLNIGALANMPMELSPELIVRMFGIVVPPVGSVAGFL